MYLVFIKLSASLPNNFNSLKLPLIVISDITILFIVGHIIKLKL
jgi:hypothetical protein